MLGRLKHAVGEVAAHGRARRDQAERRILGDLGGECHRRRAHLVLRHQHIGEPHGVGFLAADAAAGVEHQRRMGGANHQRQRDRQPEAGMEAEPGEIGGKARLRAGHAEVRHHGKPEPAADRRAMHRRDDRLFGAEQPVALEIKMLHGLLAVELARPLAFVVERRTIAEIGAGAERLALRCQHHRAAIDVLIERLERAGDFLDQRDVEKIIRRPPDLDQRHVAGLLDGDILERTHAIFLATRRRCAAPDAVV